MNASRTLIIAEAGVNHGGSLERALQLIDAGTQAGADAVKFQTFKSEAIISRFAAKANYQVRNTGTNESQLEMVKKLELDEAAHKCLAARSKERGVQFLSTPFDFQSVNFLVHEVGIKCIKIGSGEITNAPLLLHIAKTGLPVILSTGMSTLADVEDALSVLAFGYVETDEPASAAAFRNALQSTEGQKMLQERVALLHCTTDYPTSFSDVNLRAMDTLASAFGLPVGISDHSRGYSVAIAAVARGACIVEKHFTLDRTLPGPDHKASLEPDELATMVQAIRDVEQALGSPRKLVASTEAENQLVARRSLVALQNIAEGEPFTRDNLGVKRPGAGVSPNRFWEFLGKKASRSYCPDELIVP
jgi:N-acetylneuraminate synthase